MSYPPRRSFLKSAAAAAAGTLVAAPAVAYGRILGANERVNLGIIGMGRQARGLMRNFNRESDARVVAIAEVFEPNVTWAKREDPNLAVYTDLRHLVYRQDIDAVIVATPDHWHAAATIMAVNAGKDVYVEKPTAVVVRESRAMVEAARRNDRIVQVGTQQRSQRHFQDAVEFIRGGGLGTVSFVRTWNYGNAFPDGFGNAPDTEPPPNLVWDLWLGPAPNVPYNQNRFGVFLNQDLEYQTWGTWRYFFDYGGGMMTDWGVHLLDIVHWAMDVRAPETVAAVGGKFHIRDNRDTPDTLTATYRYPGFVVHYENRQLNGMGLEGHGYGIMFHGTAGTMFIDRGGYAVTPDNGSGIEPITNSNNDAPISHQRHFLDAIRSRNLPNSDIEIGHRSTTAAMLGNVAYLTGRTIHWDGENERVLDDPEADALLDRRYREPWDLSSL
ncbi:MAG TPA: Gfo/Idh/MocA family oxidoreductase [Rhodothermales bacterium]